MIRNYKPTDYPFLLRMHRDAGLPDACLTDGLDPLFVVRRCVVENGRVIMAALVRVTSEPYLLLDHSWSNPEKRWEMLKLLTEDVCKKAKERGLEQLTCFIPPQIENSFGKRLEDLQFVRSWSSWTRNL